ncbi:putative FBD-associated F-box protein At1g50980 [Raphanus sativus]|uniref:FBD-associated F-box protein At1g50980 n=1 Tax=Raphanus sativus TaxID=3726 RepID=A0A6J0M5F6_RAPSA|nr:putative FBD-associated F-box protein At1g50980 [Raphanus sativus]
MEKPKKKEIRSMSEFPDELLLKMLNLLPTKDAVATSVLSKRWISLWKEMNAFRYDGDTVGRVYWGFALFITKLLNLDSLDLKISPYSTNKYINYLVNIAVARSLRKLRVEMVCGSFEFPKSLFIHSNLETVILEKVTLEDPPLDARFVCLKSLHLLSVRFSSDESVETLLSRCPVLEDLVVRRSSFTNVMVFTIDVPTLRSLCVDNSVGESRPEGVHGFVIRTPLLRWFSIKDRFSNYLRFEDMPELVKASVSVVCESQPELFLGSLASTQYLSLCSQTTYPPDGTSFLSLEHLELCSCSSEWWNLLTLILNDAPRLRVLKLNLFQEHCVQHDGMVSWNKPSFVPECLSSHLEIFEWRQYKGTETEREAAKYILANGSHLKKAAFYSESAEKQGMLKELECVARDSCTFVFE